MAAIPGDVDTEQQPPMTVPLRHFLVAIGFLLAGALVGLGLVVGVVPGMATAAHVHLLLAGWVCITIMGAMTQFVPVWSGVSLHSQRLASVQLVLVVVGLVVFATNMLSVLWHHSPQSLPRIMLGSLDPTDGRSSAEETAPADRSGD